MSSEMRVVLATPVSNIAINSRLALWKVFLALVLGETQVGCSFPSSQGHVAGE